MTDVIVVGSGAAGICCAGELVRLGFRVLLIAETGEVGYQFRPLPMEHGSVPIQFLTRHFYGEGGWWYQLARRLDVPLRTHQIVTALGSTRLGSGAVNRAARISSAAEFAAGLAAGSPEPLGPVARKTLGDLCRTALTMPADELASLHDVSLVEWVDKIGGDPLLTQLCGGFAAGSTYLTPDQAVQYMSVPGTFTRVRNYVFDDAALIGIDPDARNGLFIPLGRAIEARGGEVWRRRKVSRVLIESDRAAGVVLEDGTELRASVVALATGASRSVQFFGADVPHEITAVRAFETELGDYREYMTISVLDRSLFPADLGFVNTKAPDGTRLQSNFSISALAPWSAPRDREILGSELVRPASRVEAEGGAERLYCDMRATLADFVPDLAAATIEEADVSHPSFLGPSLCGPKLPRCSPSLRGLWYVGEGSVPADGIYAEGAASAGILGARAIAAAARASSP